MTKAQLASRLASATATKKEALEQFRAKLRNALANLLIEASQMGEKCRPAYVVAPRDTSDCKRLYTAQTTIPFSMISQYMLYLWTSFKLEQIPLRRKTWKRERFFPRKLSETSKTL